MWDERSEVIQALLPEFRCRFYPGYTLPIAIS